MTAFGTRLFVCCTILFMSSQVLLLFAVLMIFGAFYIAEIFRAVLPKIRLRQDKTASTPHQGEESTWNELTAHHRPVRGCKSVVFAAGPHERLAALSAPYALCHQDPWDRLTCSAPEDTRAMLARDWGVRSRIDLLTQIFWLATSGHRSNFDEERARWSTHLAGGGRALRATRRVRVIPGRRRDAVAPGAHAQQRPGHPERGLLGLGHGSRRHADAVRIRAELVDGGRGLGHARTAGSSFERTLSELDTGVGVILADTLVLELRERRGRARR